jgi:hypothetical protein
MQWKLQVSTSFPVIQIMNMSGYSKKAGPLRKFKSGTSDKSDSNVEKSIKKPLFLINTMVTLTTENDRNS